MQEDRDLLHGEAVAWGMRVALASSRLKFGDEQNQLQAAAQWIAANLPCPVDPPIAEALWNWALQDKKNEGDAVHMVLLDGLGNPVRDQPISFEMFDAALGLAETMV